MYDIGQATRQGLAEALDEGALEARLAAVAAQRWAEVDGAAKAMAIGTPETITEESSEIDREFYDYYRHRSFRLRRRSRVCSRSRTCWAPAGLPPMQGT